MLNKKGFMSMSLVYSFFIVFIAIIISLLVGYSKNNALLNNIKDDIKSDINVGSSVITYKPNLDTIESPDITNVVYPGTEYTIGGNPFVSLTNTFLRWNTEPNGSGVSYNPGAKITANTSITLYAIWN